MPQSAFDCRSISGTKPLHDDVIKWKHFPRYRPFVRGIHRSPVNSPRKGQWRGALMFSLICVWINGWVNNCEAGDLRRYRAHYNVTVMTWANVDKDLCRRMTSLGHHELKHSLFEERQLLLPSHTHYSDVIMTAITSHRWIPLTKDQ